MYEIFRLLLSYTMLSDMHTRSSNERVALSAPSGRPKGKQYLQKNIVMLNFTAVKVIIICLCHLVICDCWSCPCSSSSEIMSILNLCLCKQVVYIRSQSYISGCFSCAPVDDWLKIQQSKVRERERKKHKTKPRKAETAWTQVYLKCVIWFSKRMRNRSFISSNFMRSSWRTVPMPSGLLNEKSEKEAWQLLSTIIFCYTWL